MKTLRLMGAAVLLLATAALSGCAEDSMYMGMGTDDMAGLDVVESAADDNRFETLVVALGKAGLVDTLKGEGPFTVFAPTDTAFDQLPAGTLNNLLKPENRDQLVAVLTYHVVPGRVMAADLAGRQLQAETVNGVRLSIDGRGAVTVNDANVLETDIDASNGVIHVIDKVLLPGG